jgi:pilus assembly protein CpaC
MKRFSMNLPTIRAVMVLAALFAFCVATPAVYADKGDLKALGEKIVSRETINVTLGKGEIVKINGVVADVLVANPAIADVVAIQSDKLYIVGSQLGDTNLIVLDAEGNMLQRMDIHVKMDASAVQAYLDEVYPNEDVKVTALSDQVMLTGTVSNPAVANRITQVVSAYIGEIQPLTGSADEIIVNLLDITGEQQVMLKVKILEASKNLIKELGIETELTTTGSGLGNTDAALGVNSGTGLTQPAFGLGALVFNDGNFGPLSVLVQALEQGDMVRTLAEPNLTAISGQEAGFLAGGEFPVPAGRDTDGNVIIQFRSFGVSLNFRPVVLSENRISLQLNTEVSSLARDESVTLAGVDVPGLNIRRASTTVEVPSGGGLMIGGLLQSSTIKGMAGLPGISNVPVLGDLISSRSFNREETELVVLVTAYLVTPYAVQHNQKQPVPEEQNSPLTTAFADNIRRIYGRKAPDFLDDGSRFGYLIN